mmetsp:Transcript_33722/g.54734  ORF Transcript_33722/g.54734 Transcript_33722/m.54734 type:complete len:274 (-) Transcript_33722:394-1215(-)
MFISTSSCSTSFLLLLMMASATSSLHVSVKSSHHHRQPFPTSLYRTFPNSRGFGHPPSLTRSPPGNLRSQMGLTSAPKDGGYGNTSREDCITERCNINEQRMVSERCGVQMKKQIGRRSEFKLILLNLFIFAASLFSRSAQAAPSADTVVGADNIVAIFGDVRKKFVIERTNLDGKIIGRQRGVTVKICADVLAGKEAQKTRTIPFGERAFVNNNELCQEAQDKELSKASLDKLCDAPCTRVCQETIEGFVNKQGDALFLSYGDTFLIVLSSC